MPPISYEEMQQLVKAIKHSAVHMETRDAYGTSVELPHLAKWAAGEPDDLEWLQGWCSTVREHVEAGRTVKRTRVVSEPLSDYQRWAYGVAQPMVDAGDDIRWVPRRSVSSIAFPGNDYYLLDDRLVIFLHYAGSGLSTGMTTSTDPSAIELCRTAFEEVWKLAIPHGEYQPI